MIKWVEDEISSSIWSDVFLGVKVLFLGEKCWDDEDYDDDDNVDVDGDDGGGILLIDLFNLHGGY